MGSFTVTSVYFGTNQMAHRAAPAQPLDLVDGGALWKLFRKELLDDAQRFEVKVNLPGLPELRGEWMSAGQTAGVAAWRSGKQTHPDKVGAVSLLFNGLEGSGADDVELKGQSQRSLPVG